MMNIDFTQLYYEPGTRFDSITPMILDLLYERLDALKVSIPHFEEKLKDENYSLVFIISATKEKTTLEVRGPNILRKSKDVEFALHIPYKEVVNFTDQVAYVLDFIAEGIVWVFEKYAISSSGVAEAVESVARTVQENPEAFQYKKK
ncbi:hypothetical protein [Paenibacillus elgii]|uniref:hypothetical protein n=1 Tax=Paenibacillus elgii TaxID=189691 RepID=UPI000248D7B2|nr:hypothetical protein [Paenibacillus elgii]